MFAEISPDNWNPWTWNDMRRIAEAKAKGGEEKNRISNNGIGIFVIPVLFFDRAILR